MNITKANKFQKNSDSVQLKDYKKYLLTGIFQSSDQNRTVCKLCVNGQKRRGSALPQTLILPLSG
jgi:hypothetical protein